MKLDHRLLEAHRDGMIPELLSGDVVTDSNEHAIPVLQRYLTGAQAFLIQPSHFYDIIGTGRTLPLIVSLGQALDYLQTTPVAGLDEKLNRLRSLVHREEFEAALFEVLVAHRYRALPGIECVRFITSRADRKTPDIEVSGSQFNGCVECKKQKRSAEYSTRLRKLVSSKLQPTFAQLRSLGISAVCELTFHESPYGVSETRIRDLVGAALAESVPIITSSLTIAARPLPPFTCNEYVLFPSPKFSWERYQYRIRGEWFGLVSQQHCRMASHVDTLRRPKYGISTWVDEINWDVGIKWKIQNEDALWRCRRLGYDLLFDGLQQLITHGGDSVLYCWIETEFALGRRKTQLLDFFRRLSDARRPVGWVVFNESLVDISPKGNFDFIEHSHAIQGPRACGQRPPVTRIFGSDGPDDTQRGEWGEWGVGADLKDIDELEQSEDSHRRCTDLRD